MANRLQLRRGSGAPGGVFYEGEPIYDKIGKVLFVGNNGASGSGAGSSIASEDTHLSSLEILSRASSTSSAFIKLGEDTDNANHYVSLKAPASIASNFTLTLPSADGSSGQVLQTNGGGTLSFTTLLTDLVGDTTPQLGGDLDLNSNDITGTGNLNVSGIGTFTTVDAVSVTLKNSRYLYFGNSNEGSITYDSTNLEIATSSGDLNLKGSGSVALFEGVNKKFETSINGATLTGILIADGVSLGATEKLIFNGNNLEIYADGSNNAYIDVSNTSNNNGDLYIRNNVKADYGRDIYIQAKKDENSIVCTHDAAVELYYDNVKKLETTGSGASVTGDLYVSGNLNVVGTAVTFSTETVKVEDRIMELGLVNGAAPSLATTWDLGLLFNYNSSGAKKSGVVWLDNTFIAAAADVTESSDTGNADPQVSVTTLASFVANDLYLGGTASGNQIINSSGQAQNLVFDGGSY